jgi:hypothetical protein
MLNQKIGEKFMKKIVLAFIALGVAFAISSCADQNQAGRCKENQKNESEQSRGGQTEDKPYRFDKKREQAPKGSCPDDSVRQHRKW